MSDTPQSILKDAEASMKKSLEYLQNELRGLRAGRASTALVDFIKVEVYGSFTEIKNVAATSTPEATQILIKPFDPSTLGAIRQGIESSSLGLHPIVEDKHIRINVPQLSSDRRKELGNQAKKMGEEQKVSMRNVRRDANKHADALAKSTKVTYSEDQIKKVHDDVQNLLKKYEAEADKAVKAKVDEITQV
jgi:ribosome recycling factor